jgi:hypothetical protein
MTTAAMISLYKYPNWWKAAQTLIQHVDHFVLRVDPKHTHQDIIQQIYEQPPTLFGKKVTIYQSHLVWNRWNWREEMLRELDAMKPDLVLCPDEDEIFDPMLAAELPEFMASDKSAMMFRYHAPLPTCDGAILFDGKPYPGAPHMKAFKWRPGLTYRDYTGYARVTDYADPACHWMAETEIWHYMGYTPELREQHEMKW